MQTVHGGGSPWREPARTSRPRPAHFTTEPWFLIGSVLATVVFIVVALIATGAIAILATVLAAFGGVVLACATLLNAAAKYRR